LFADVHADKVRTLHVPCYKGLNIESILAKGKENPEVAHYLPDERDHHRLPRDWLVNVTYTVMKDAFSSWVSERVKARNDTVLENRDLIISMDPLIAKSFKESVNVSSK